MRFVQSNNRNSKIVSIPSDSGIDLKIHKGEQHCYCNSFIYLKISMILN